MFNFLKKGIKDTLAKFQKKVDSIEDKQSSGETETPKEAKTETIEPTVSKKEGKISLEEEEITVKEELIEDTKLGFLGRIKKSISTKKINETQFEEFFWDLEVVLLENGVAVEVIDKIKEDLKVDLVNTPLQRGKIEAIIRESLRKSMKEIFSIPTFNLMDKAKMKKPLTILILGVNGTGKTSTIAKLIHLFQENHLRCVIGAADTFRAGSEEQLKVHADKLNVKLVKHQYGADPAAVAFDTKKYAESHGLDIALIDTAGRLHSNANLMDELKKVVRVVQPDIKLFIGESIAGNDVVEQAKEFDKAVGIDGIILTKLDVDEKGGAAVSVSYITGKPILYFCVGQEYKDLETFSIERMHKLLEI